MTDWQFTLSCSFLVTAVHTFLISIRISKSYIGKSIHCQRRSHCRCHECSEAPKNSDWGYPTPHIFGHLVTCNWLQNCTSGVFQLFYCFRNSEKEKEGDGEKVRGERIEGRVDNPPPIFETWLHQCTLRGPRQSRFICYITHVVCAHV